MSEPLKTIKFQCTRCGHCCNHLITKTELGHAGMYLTPAETRMFPSQYVKPLYGVGMKGKSRPRPAKIVAYQFIQPNCPYYKDGCSIYEKRPNICRSFPIEVNIASRECPTIAGMIGQDMQVNIDRSTIQNELQANKEHMEYLIAQKKKGYDDNFWFWCIDENRWALVKFKDESK